MTNINDGLARLETIIAKEEKRSSVRKSLTAWFVAFLTATGCWFSLWAVKQHRIVEGATVQTARAQTEAQNAVDEAKQAQTQVDVGNIVASGRERLERRDWGGAMAEYDRALEIAPDNPPALQAKGYLLFREGKLDEAIAFLTRSADSDPEYEWAHYNLALAYWKAGNPSAALKQVKDVLRLDPSFHKTFRSDANFAPYIRTSPEFQLLLKEAAATPIRDQN